MEMEEMDLVLVFPSGLLGLYAHFPEPKWTGCASAAAEWHSDAVDRNGIVWFSNPGFMDCISEKG